MISTRGKLEIVVGAIALVVAVLAFRTWLSEHDARIQAEDKMHASAAQIDQLKAADQERDKQSVAQVAAIDKSAAAAKTPQQIIKWVPQQVQLPAPIKMEIPPATASAPAPDVQASIPQVDLPVIRDQIAKCETCDVQLHSAQADLASSKKQNQLLEGELQDVQTELKGGTFWKRTKRAVKWLGIGAVAGAAAVCGTGHCK